MYAAVDCFPVPRWAYGDGAPRRELNNGVERPAPEIRSEAHGEGRMSDPLVATRPREAATTTHTLLGHYLEPLRGFGVPN